MGKNEQYSELVNSIEVLDLASQVTELLGPEKESILTNIKNEFVIDNPRVWWLSFKKKPMSYDFEDEFQYKKITTFFDDKEICYFITELESLHIFLTSVRNIIDIIGDCSFFEYYIVDLNLTKLLCETEHGDMLFIDNTRTHC